MTRDVREGALLTRDGWRALNAVSLFIAIPASFLSMVLLVAHVFTWEWSGWGWLLGALAVSAVSGLSAVVCDDRS
jgi:hypothetical protein